MLLVPFNCIDLGCLDFLVNFLPGVFEDKKHELMGI